MLRSLTSDSFADPFATNARVLLAPDDGGGTGGDAGSQGGNQGGDEGGNKPKTYTQAEVDDQLARSMKRWRKGLQEENKKKEEQIQALTQQLEEVKAQVANNGDKKQDDTLEGKIELLTRRYEKQLSDFQVKFQAEQEARLNAEKKAQETQRMTSIRDALAQAGCRTDAMVTAERHVSPDVQWDEVDEKFVYTSPTGALLDLKEGIKEYLPDYLKASTVQGGGSGARGTSQKRERATTELEAEKKKLAQFEADAMRNRQNMSVLTRWRMQKKRVEELEKQLREIK